MSRDLRTGKCDLENFFSFACENCRTLTPSPIEGCSMRAYKMNNSLRKLKKRSPNDDVCHCPSVLLDVSTTSPYHSACVPSYSKCHVILTSTRELRMWKKVLSVWHFGDVCLRPFKEFSTFILSSTQFVSYSRSAVCAIVSFNVLFFIPTFSDIFPSWHLVGCVIRELNTHICVFSERRTSNKFGYLPLTTPICNDVTTDNSLKRDYHSRRD